MRFIQSYDVAASKAVGKIPKSVHRYFDILGYATMPAVWAAVLALTAIISWASGREYAAHLVVLCLVPVATIMKLVIRRRRPMTIYAEAMKVKSYSFPSSHAYSAALAGGYCASLAFDRGWPAAGAALILLVITVGVSRVHLGAHYPSDVTAGWLLGTGLVLALPLPL